MNFRITVEALDADPGNEDMSYIADTSTLVLTVVADSSFDALSEAAAGRAELE